MMFWRSWPQMVPTLLGTLLGVRTATVYAREYPEDVRSLAVLEPVFTFSYPLERSFANASPVCRRKKRSVSECLSMRQ